MYCSDHLNSPFEISEIPKTLVPHRSNLNEIAGRLPSLRYSDLVLTGPAIVTPMVAVHHAEYGRSF
jgi:hypothetical protein